jgi:hypothetical protein
MIAAARSIDWMLPGIRLTNRVDENCSAHSEARRPVAQSAHAVAPSNTPERAAASTTALLVDLRGKLRELREGHRNADGVPDQRALACAPRYTRGPPIRGSTQRSPSPWFVVSFWSQGLIGDDRGKCAQPVPVYRAQANPRPDS